MFCFITHFRSLYKSFNIWIWAILNNLDIAVKLSNNIAQEIQFQLLSGLRRKYVLSICTLSDTVVHKILCIALYVDLENTFESKDMLLVSVVPLEGKSLIYAISDIYLIRFSRKSLTFQAKPKIYLYKYCFQIGNINFIQHPPSPIQKIKKSLLQSK